jgi:hypothetical protein
MCPSTFLYCQCISLTEAMREPIPNGNPHQVCNEICQTHQYLTMVLEENAPTTPLNWPRPNKWNVTLVFSPSVIPMPLPSSIVRLIEHCQKRTAYGQLIEAVLVLPTFVSTYCLSPLILGPLNEIFRRATVLPSGNSFYPGLQPDVLGRLK